MNSQDIIIRPVITEKSIALAGKDKYTFLVARAAKKDEIQKAVQDVFNVTVVSVASMVSKGGSIRTGMKRVEVTKQPAKKAIVTVKKGDKIGIFEVGA